MSRIPFELKELSPRDYSGYFLTQNPFPAISVAEEDPKVFVDRDRVMKGVHDLIVSVMTTGKSQTMVIQGTYGSGKSHILKFVRSKINAQLSMNPKNKALAVYVESPRSTFTEMYSEIVIGIGLAFAKDIAARVLTNYLITNPSELERAVIKRTKDSSASKLLEMLKKDYTCLSEIMSSGELKQFDVIHSAAQSMQNEFKIRDYPFAFFRILDPGTESSSWRWILGERLERQERGLLEVNSLIEENGLDAFHDFKLLYLKAGFKALFILLDELERVTELHSSLESRYFDDLRHFVDNSTDNVCLVSCVTPGGFAAIQASGHPLQRRLLSFNETLEPFDFDLSAKLVSAYIADARDEYQKISGKKDEAMDKKISSLHRGADPGIFPFTKDSLTTIHEITGGNVGDLLTACSRLLDAACDQKLEVISDSAFVKTVLKE